MSQEIEVIHVDNARDVRSGCDTTFKATCCKNSPRDWLLAATSLKKSLKQEFSDTQLNIFQ